MVLYGRLAIVERRGEVELSVATAQGSKVKLFDSLIIRQLEVNEVEFSEAPDNRLCSLCESHMHHEYDQFSHFLLNSVEHLLHDLDRLVSQKLAFVPLLVLERSAPGEQPAHEHIGLLVLHVELILSLFSSAHFD